MPNLQHSRDAIFQNWPHDWPSKANAVFQNDVTPKQYRLLEVLIKGKAGERVIEKCLRENKELLSLIVGLFSSGTHASWVFPKEQIGLPSGRTGGLIADYLLAGADSDGVKWFVLELKGADKRAFLKTGKHVALSNDANRGICQLLSYVDLSSSVQANLRDNSKLVGFREPQGILLIGSDDETKDTVTRDFKQAWNRVNPSLRIRSYNSLLRLAEGKLRDLHKLESSPQ